jgi:hypothetical protein
MSAYEERIEELLAAANASFPNNPDWFNRMCVEAYLRDFEFPELETVIEECPIPAEKPEDDSKENEAA